MDYSNINFVDEEAELKLIRDKLKKHPELKDRIQNEMYFLGDALIKSLESLER